MLKGDVDPLMEPLTKREGNEEKAASKVAGGGKAILLAPTR